mmetsp:Transcript_97039/g.177836  ORF Transcript_97039/g.177836 Transcript_97039/m.177836 type:complete len:230 (+) Transcript_97039:112-801(+)
MAPLIRSKVLCLLAIFVGIAAEPCKEDSTCADVTVADAVQGSALLQVKRPTDGTDVNNTINATQIAEEEEEPEEDPTLVAINAADVSKVASCMQFKIREVYMKSLQQASSKLASECDMTSDREKHGSGARDPFTAPLDATGFLSVTSTCCAWKTETFFTRLLESMDYRICSEPHFQGLMHWFTCVPAMDFQYLLEIIANGNEHGCKFWAKNGDACPAIVGTKCDNPCKP